MELQTYKSSRYVYSEVIDVPVSVFGYVDLPRLSSGLSPAGQVDSVAKQAVPRRPLADHAGDHFPGVDTDGQLLYITCILQYFIA